MDRKTRICVWIIILGLVNFIAFTMMYIIIGGDAKNGRVETIDGRRCYLVRMRGSEREAASQHVLPTTLPTPDRPLLRVPGTRIYKSYDGTPYKDIGKGPYIYSGVHSILILLTVGAVLLAMLTLAKDHIVTAMENHIINGRALIHVFATVVVLTTVMMMLLFLLDFINELRG